MGMNKTVPDKTATDETIPPKAKDPISPIKTLAGFALCFKNPRQAPLVAALARAIPSYI
jgi:Fe-S oxidoreductase